MINITEANDLLERASRHEELSEAEQEVLVDFFDHMLTEMASLTAVIVEATKPLLETVSRFIDSLPDDVRKALTEQPSMITFND